MGAVAVLVVVTSAPTVYAAPPTPAPLAVQSASFAQAGQDVVWSVQLRSPFSPGALGPDGRSLCLLIERVGDAEATGQVCLLGPRADGGTPRLQYRPIVAAGPGRAALGPGSIVSAIITRSGGRELTATFRPTAIANAYTPVRWQVRSTLAPPHCATPTGTACVALWPARGRWRRSTNPCPSAVRPPARRSSAG